MTYIEETNKSVQDVVAMIQDIASNYKFGVLHIHNVKETLQSKGVEMNNECQILDVCNPNYAKKLLDADMSVACVLPCKISVYEDQGKTMIVMNSIVQLIDDINPDLTDIAQEVQEILLELINEVK